MYLQRRSFIKTIGGLAGLTLAPPIFNPVKAASLEEAFQQTAHLSPTALATDEDFWNNIRQAFEVSATIINLNNAGVSPHARIVRETTNTYDRNANEIPGFNMWRTQRRQRFSVRRQLADLAGCDREEIAILRNTTEALDTVLLGIDFTKGDEILTTDQDYPSMLHTLRQLEERHGVVVKKISLPVPITDPAEVTRRFVNAMTRKTRLVQVCHMINLTGEVLPVKDICEAAHSRDIKVLVDGAHTFGQIDFNIPDLGCDYFGTSLHKWLCAPFGTGMLYVKKENIPDLWALYPPPENEADKITKFEHLGTRSFPIELAISKAIEFHNAIGSKRKQARLHYLKTYWTDKAKGIPGISFHTNLSPDHSCAIVNFTLEGKEPSKVAHSLLVDHQIYTTVTHHKDVTGIRISPNVYTMLGELDYFVEVLGEMAVTQK